MVKDDDQQTADGGTAEGDVEESATVAAEESDTVVKQRPSSSNLSSSNVSQPVELQNDEQPEETPEIEEEKSAEDLRTLEEELDKITVSPPTMYAIILFHFHSLQLHRHWKLVLYAYRVCLN